MYLAIIVLPLLGSIVSGFFGRKVGVSGAQLITCGCVIITTFLAVIAFFEVGLNNIPVSIQLFRWVDSESLNVLWGFHFDSLTVSMLIPVLIVSSLVHIYSIGYMSHDPHNQRFFSYLSLFTFMMIILVTANNFLLMFVGWEGVGICSYLLVSFWFTRIAANQSSMSAFLTNRVGDCFLTIGMFAILWSFGNIDYSTVFSLSPYISENIVTIIGICLLIGAMAKSSQVGLHVWLPMAMEGPTPVSALIHAATMVTAGVYLLMRTSPLIEYSSTVLILCLWIGAITTVFSSLIGLFQQDIKKVIAYSTMSQLGMMVIAVGLSSYNIALFHLVNHAFYKGLLFLGAGAVIHAVSDNQDFRKYGGLRPFLPLTYSVMLIASLSLVAFPFMTGFYSKDFILESAYGQFYFSSTVVYFIATIGAMFTTLYSVKVLYLTFLTNPNGPLVNYKKAHEGDMYMSLPLIILAIFSIFFGYITKDIFIGLGSDFFADNSIFIHPSHEIMLDTEFAVPHIFKLLPLFLTIILSVFSLTFSEFLPRLLILFKLTRLGYNIFSFFNQRFLIELFYNKYIISIILKLGGQTTKVLDKGSIELLGPYGLENGLLNLSNNLSRLDTGVITSYALYILISLIFYILIPYLSLADSSLLLLVLFALFTLNNVSRSGNSISNSTSATTNNNEIKSNNSPLNSSILYKNALLSKFYLEAIHSRYTGTSLFYNLLLFIVSLVFVISLAFEFIDCYNYILYLINIISGNITITNMCCVYIISYLSIYIKNLLYSCFYIEEFIKLIKKGSDKQIIFIFVYICIEDIYVKYINLIIWFFILSIYLNANFPMFFDIIITGLSITILLFSLYVYIHINYIDIKFKYKYPYLYILLNIVTIILMLISIILVNKFSKILYEKLYELLKDNTLNVKGGSSNKPDDNNSDSDKGNPHNKPNNPNKGKNPVYNPGKDREESQDEYELSQDESELSQDDTTMNYSKDWEESSREDPQNSEAMSSGPSNLGASNSSTLDTGVSRKKYVRTDYSELEDWEKKDIKKASKAQYDSKYYGKNKEIINKKQKDYNETHKQAITDDQKLYREINKNELSNKKRKYNDEHREQISKYNSDYYEKNYDKVNEKNKVNREKPENKSKQDAYNKQYRKDNLDDLRQYDRDRRTDEKSKLEKKEYDRLNRIKKQDSLTEEQKAAQREKDRIRAQNKRAKIKKDKEDKEKNG